jgi:DNA-binding SARP family transcriptional activator
MEFRVLGPVEVWDGERRLSLGGTKERAVLAYLLLHANQLVPSERLVDELWGGDAPASALRSLRVRVSELRKALGPAGTSLAGRASGYVLELGREELDLRRFERLVSEAEGAEARLSAAKLRQALELWRGPPLADFTYESWASAPIARLEELRLVALERRLEAELAVGEYAGLIGELEALVAEHPLRERPRALLMAALYQSGRQAEALQAYQAGRRTLVEELGIEPGPELQELEKAILRHDSSLDSLRRPPVDRSILVAARAEESLPGLLELGERMAWRPRRELILARLSAPADLGLAARRLAEHADALQSRGLVARSVAFTPQRSGRDLVRLASEEAVDLVLVDGMPALLDDPNLREILTGAPCDVGVVVGRDGVAGVGPILVPFTGADHDWAAVEIAAWLARSGGEPLRLAGPVEEGRDASPLLARASLAVQRALGVSAEPLLVEPGAAGLVAAAEDASLVVVGFSERWRSEGLRGARLSLARNARPAAVFVRRGLRPGGLAPPESHTRFTWSVGAVSP